MIFKRKYIILIIVFILIPRLHKANSSDSTNRIRLFSGVKGNISLGYDYGYIPFTQNLNVPSGYFKTEGNFSLFIKDLPFNSTFFYTDLKNITGLNNYFRVSFDLQVFRQRLMERTAGRLLQYKEKFTELQKQYQVVQQKLGYIKHVNSNLDQYFVKHSQQLSLEKVSIDSLNPLHDTASIPPIDILTIENPVQHIQIDTTDYKKLYSEYKDSIQRRYDDLMQQSNSITKRIDEIKIVSEQLSNPNSLFGSDSLMYRNKAEKWFSHLQKLDVGLCYPSYSTFLISNIPVKGINIEYENKNRFYAFTLGTTINNLLFTNNIIQNNLQNTQNLFNFFDFNNLQQGRRIISGKAGIGKKDGDHFFVGALYSVGQQSYYYDSIQSSDSEHQPKEHNVVMELDGSIQVKKWLTLNLVYGKSSIRPLNDESDTTNSSLSQLFSPFRSNAALGKVIVSLTKIKSTFILSGRWVDPFFRSYGIGFMRSDNFRYEIKSDHQLGKKIKAGLYYRKDQNNLLNLFSYTTILHSGGANLQYRVSKNISMRANFNPVFQYSFNQIDQSAYTNKNYIASYMFSYQTRMKKMSMTSNLSSSYYKLFNGFNNTDYINFTLNNSINCKKISNNFSASLFKMNGVDSLSGNTILLYNELSSQFKKLKLSAGLKYSNNLLLGNQFGYNLKLQVQLCKLISIELRGEKLVLGDFYNSIGIDQYRAYPYIWSSRVIINW